MALLLIDGMDGAAGAARAKPLFAVVFITVVPLFVVTNSRESLEKLMGCIAALVSCIAARVKRMELPPGSQSP